MGTGRPVSDLADRMFAGLAVQVLLLDPGVGLCQAVSQGRVQFPAQDLSNHRIVAVAGDDALWSSELIVVVQLDAADFLDEVFQVVDGDERAGYQVHRCCGQLLAVHDQVDEEKK